MSSSCAKVAFLSLILLTLFSACDPLPTPSETPSDDTPSTTESPSPSETMSPDLTATEELTPLPT